MNRQRTLQAWPTTFTPPPEDRTPIPVLIQVPRVAAYSRPSRRWSGRARVKPRRRLRREVRWVCYAMLAVLPPALSAFAYWEGRQAALLEIRAPQAAEAAAEPLPPRVSLSIEPALPPPPAEPAAPVVFPGYLLPDDGLEEPAHARD
jgi:hypothetical protein